MKLKINGVDWKISIGELPENIFGETFVSELKIAISSKLTNYTIIMSTIVHELTHAYLFSHGFYLNAACFNEEQLCEFMSMNALNILTYADKVFNQLYVLPATKKQTKETEACQQ